MEEGLKGKGVKRPRESRAEKSSVAASKLEAKRTPPNFLTALILRGSWAVETKGPSAAAAIAP